MEFCTEHPDELTKVAAVQKKVGLVKPASRVAQVLPENTVAGTGLAVGRGISACTVKGAAKQGEPATSSCSCKGPLCLQVDQVRNIMVDNIEKVLERGERIELLVDKSEQLRNQVRLHAAAAAAHAGALLHWTPDKAHNSHLPSTLS